MTAHHINPTDAVWLTHFAQDTQDWVQYPLDQLALALLDNYSSTDPALRDSLSYTLLERLMSEERVSANTVIEVAHKSIDAEHLFWRIGEKETDSVFMRAFSILTVPIVLQYYEKHPPIPEPLWDSLLEATLRYATLEDDWRGYVLHKGWAHAAAHLADALGSLGSKDCLDGRTVKAVLTALHDVATVPVALGHTEDDRLAYGAFTLIESQRLSAESVMAWLDSFPWIPAGNVGMETIRGANANHFLRSLYFRYLYHDPKSPHLALIAAAARRFDIFQRTQG